MLHFEVGESPDRKEEEFEVDPEHIEDPKRRRVLKLLVTFLGGASVLGLQGCFEEKSDNTRTVEKTDFEKLPLDFWFRIVENIYEKYGNEPSPTRLRAHVIVRALGVPSGQQSALYTTAGGERIDPAADEIIAAELTNSAGVWSDKWGGITSSDFRDFSPEGLSMEVLEKVSPEIKAIFAIMYEYEQDIRRRFGDTQDGEEATYNSSYARLPGGIDVLMHGYAHSNRSQRIHEDYYARLCSLAKVIVLEGYSNMPYGASLKRIENPSLFNFNRSYHRLMRQAKKKGLQASSRKWMLVMQAGLVWSAL